MPSNPPLAPPHLTAEEARLWARLHMASDHPDVAAIEAVSIALLTTLSDVRARLAEWMSAHEEAATERDRLIALLPGLVNDNAELRAILRRAHEFLADFAPNDPEHRALVSAIAALLGEGEGATP